MTTRWMRERTNNLKNWFWFKYKNVCTIYHDETFTLNGEVTATASCVDGIYKLNINQSVNSLSSLSYLTNLAINSGENVDLGSLLRIQQRSDRQNTEPSTTHPGKVFKVTIFHTSPHERIKSLLIAYCNKWTV